MPSVEDVFNMQTRGERWVLLPPIPFHLRVYLLSICVPTRCITAFVKEDELYRMMKDSYPPYAEMDALHFLMHDIQVPCLATLSPLLHLRKFLIPSIWRDLQIQSFIVSRYAYLQDSNHY